MTDVPAADQLQSFDSYAVPWGSCTSTSSSSGPAEGVRLGPGHRQVGSFVWFPEGMLMEHGATDDADVLTLFITNKPFDIRYAFEDDQEGGSAG